MSPKFMTSNSGYAFISHSQQSYPSQQPSIDNLQLARRKRRRTTPTELSVLEREFAKCCKPSKRSREEIARRVNMSEKAVQIWFQNKRQATRKQSQRMLTSSSSGSSSSDRSSEIGSSPAIRSRSEDFLSSSTIQFKVYQDPELERRKKFCLSMGDDGKATVFTALKTPTKKGKYKNPPLTPVKSSSLNALKHLGSRSPSKSPKKSPSKSPSAREKECISHLLSLKGGDWFS